MCCRREVLSMVTIYDTVTHVDISLTFLFSEAE